MRQITPRLLISGREIDFFGGEYQSNGNLTPATITFTMPLTEGVAKHLWNKEVTLFFHDYDSKPLFRGWIKRVKEDFNQVEIYAEDAIGYMVKGGSQEVARLALTNGSNIDGLTLGPAIKKLMTLSNLDSKLKTDYVGDTTPAVTTVDEPFRGTYNPLDIIKTMLSKAVDNSATIPKPNIARLIDDGSNSQIIIELESNLDTSTIAHVFTEHDNITNLEIINRKIPTIIVVNGANNVKGTFSHDSAISAYDRNYFEVSNDALLSPAACKDFAEKLFRANLKVQYEYTFDTFEGVYLNENDVIKVITDEEEYSGNYRVIGKSINFTPKSFSVGLNINRKPPTLAEYIASLDS